MAVELPKGACAMTRTITYREAVNEALRQEMRRDQSVILIGEDVAGGSGRPPEMQDAWGGVMGVTKGLLQEFGPERVLDTPISESGFIGAAIGAAASGMRPVAELMFIGFMGVCLDQLINQAAKLRYMFGGKARVPLTIRTMIGGGLRAAAQHSTVDYSGTRTRLSWTEVRRSFDSIRCEGVAGCCHPRR